MSNNVAKKLGYPLKKICIYGAGKLGLYLFELLHVNDYSIDYFCDASSQKHGTMVNGIPCLSLEDLKKQRISDILVIVSPLIKEEIVQMLQSNGFECVIEGIEPVIDCLFPFQIKNLSFNLTEHCNLNCKYCNHFCGVAEEYNVPKETLYQDFKTLAKVTENQVRFVKLIGGEPLLHPDLLEIIQKARKYFPRPTKILLGTNALTLLKQIDEFWDICSKNQIGIISTKYPIKMDYDALEEKCQKHSIEITYFNDKKVIKTMNRYVLDLHGKQDMVESFHMCEMKEICGTVAEGKLYLCAIPSAVHVFNKAFQKKLEVKPSDYLELPKIKTREEIFNFMKRPNSFCRYCDLKGMTFGHPWEISKKELSEWVVCE